MTGMGSKYVQTAGCHHFYRILHKEIHGTFCSWWGTVQQLWPQSATLTGGPKSWKAVEVRPQFACEPYDACHHFRCSLGTSTLQITIPNVESCWANPLNFPLTCTLLVRLPTAYQSVDVPTLTISSAVLGVKILVIRATLDTNFAKRDTMSRVSV